MLKLGKVEDVSLNEVRVPNLKLFLQIFAGTGSPNNVYMRILSWLTIVYSTCYKITLYVLSYNATWIQGRMQDRFSPWCCTEVQGMAPYRG